ncbi:hypothetical protein [Streptomyces sp. NPDC060205]|uniref:hypothetical protein n=1 Tax=Streptomyces sp. NPDC060205 TaxID=3347072 RepID=UPI00365C6C99
MARVVLDSKPQWGPATDLAHLLVHQALRELIVRSAVCTRFRRYALAGVFSRGLQQIQAHADAAGDID